MTSRREFIKIVALGSGALAFGVRLAGAEDSSRPFVPNAWLRIEPDGSIVIQAGKSELGQGVRTSLPMVVAEELDADFAQVRVEQASPGPDFRRLGTGGSSSLMGSWNPLRQAGATARAMLVAAAAARWGVDPASCTTASSRVSHPPTNRSLAYRELLADAAKQPVPSAPPLKKPAEFKIVGKSQERIDGKDIVTGKATYGLDVRLPGMLYAAVSRAPILGASVKSFDAADALKVAGVKRVVQITAGVAVIGESTWAALAGRDALKVAWTDSPHASFSSAALMDELVKLSEKPGITIRRDGTGRAGIERATKRVGATYRYPWAAHATVEPMNCTALVTNDRCELWTPTQTPNGVQATAVGMLGLPESAVKVNVILSGGGFGRRLGVDVETEAIEIAKAIKGTPMHLCWTREDDMRHGFFQAPSVHRFEAGIDAGKVVAWEHRKVSIPHNIRGGAPSAKQLSDPAAAIDWAWGVYDAPYAWPDAEMTYRGVLAPTPIGPWRSVFSPSSVFARECFIDELAESLDRDPVALRLELLGAGNPEVANRLEINGSVIERDRMIRVIELVRQRSGWGSKPATGRAWGFAASFFHTGTCVAHAVEVSLRKSSRTGELPFAVHRIVCGIDCGLAVNPDGIAQQVESGVLWSLSNMKNEITFEKGRVIQGNYDDFPIASIGDTPPVIETHIVRSDAERPTGIGEPVVDTVAPAVASAVSRLAGRRIRALPVRASDLA